MTCKREEMERPVSDRKTRSQSQVQVPAQGGDFVDYNLGIVLRSWPGTIFAFRQGHVHGGTPLYLTRQTGAAFTISKAVADAFEATLAQESAGMTVNDPDPDGDIGILGLDLEALTVQDDD